jgi:hypothetical protein
VAPSPSLSTIVSPMAATRTRNRLLVRRRYDADVKTDAVRIVPEARTPIAQVDRNLSVNEIMLELGDGQACPHRTRQAVQAPTTVRGAPTEQDPLLPSV